MMGEHLSNNASPATKRKDKGKQRARDPLVAGEHAAAVATAGPSSSTMASSSWDCIPVARSEVSDIPPVWSKDGRFYFTAANTSVFVHASSNFARLSTLSSTDSNGHRKRITALLIHPTNPLQLITAAEDGTIKIWDWVEGRHIRTIVVADDGQVNHMCIGQIGDKWWIFTTVTNPKPGKKVKEDGSHIQYRIMRVPLLPQAASTTDKPVAYLYAVGKLRAPPAALLISPRTNYVVALAGTKAYVYRLPTSETTDKWKPQCVKFVSDERFTCGAFAPDRVTRSGVVQEEWFATGDSKGVIRLWHGLGAAFRQLDAAALEAQHTDSDKMMHAETEKRLPTTSLHWHAHAVAAIAFTPAGAQILSVGEESVLVQWHLASGKREYIPRLGGRPILSVAVRPGDRGVEEEFWMGFADGSLLRVGATTGAVSAVGQGVRLDPLRPGSNRVYPIAIHPATKALVVPSSHPSTLQFIDPLASTVLFDLEVAPSNRVSRRDEKHLEPVAVEHVAFSAPRDGRSEWMATIEGRRSDQHEGGGFVKTLKFWRWSGDRYIVNTQYPRPHGSEDITALAFGAPSPSAEPFAVTASASGSVKLWHVRQVKKPENGKNAKKPVVAELYWAMRSSFSYRSLPVHSAAFSPDATLLALGHGSVVTLWDTQSNLMLRALDAGSDGRKVAFTCSEGRYLVGGGAQKGVLVWDVLSCEAVQSHPTQATEFLVPLSSGFIAGGQSKDTTTFSFFTAEGTLERTATIKTALTALTALPTAGSIHLVGISPSGEIYRFGDMQTAAAPAARSVASSAGPVKRATSIWQEMFGKDAFLDDLELAPEPEQAAVAVSALQRRAAGHPAQVFDGPSHTLPPVGMLFEAFMDELLGSRDETEEDAGEAIEIDALPTISAAPLSLSSDAVRKVPDAEVAELETFFAGLLSTAPKKAAKRANGSLTVQEKENGTPAKSTPVKAKKIATQSPAVSTPGDEPEVDGKRKSKKRKAPRNSQA